MGFTTEWIRRAISEGVTIRGQVVKLEAERLVLDRRTHYRIHEDSFVVFLMAIGWKHLPRRTDGPSPDATLHQDDPRDVRRELHLQPRASAGEGA